MNNQYNHLILTLLRHFHNLNRCNLNGLIDLLLYILGTPKYPYFPFKRPYLYLRDYNDASHTSTSDNVFWQISGVGSSNITSLKGSEPHTLEDQFSAWFHPQLI